MRSLMIYISAGHIYMMAKYTSLAHNILQCAVQSRLDVVRGGGGGYSHIWAM